MAEPDTSFYSAHCHDDSLSRFLLKRKPSSDSLRARLQTIAAPSNTPKRGRQNPPSSPDKPRLVRISRRILTRKPHALKEEEDEIKKITRERLFWHKQQEEADARTQDGPMAPARPKHFGGIQQLNALKHQIQTIKHHRYPELPSPKPDDWFCEEKEEVSSLSETNSSTKRRRQASNIPHKSRVLVERGVGSIQRKIKSIKLKPSHSSPLHLNRPPNQPQEPVPEQASQTISTPPSLTNFSSSLGTPDTDTSQARFSSHQVSPNSTNQYPGKAQKIFRALPHTRKTTKPSSLTLPDPITENHPQETHAPAVDRPGTRPTPLSIVTQGLPEPGPSNNQSQPGHVSPRNWPDTSSELPQWQNSAMEFLADDRTGQIDRWVFSSSLLAQPCSDPTGGRRAHRLSLDVPPREFSETRRRRSEHEWRAHQAFLSTGLPALARDPAASPLGNAPILEPLYFVEKQTPSQVILATDVLIEQQGGLSFLGQENFNERFRSKPWQTVKTIRQYDRPGHLDAEYLPGLTRLAVVQTPHSTDTFPLPTPEWYWLTEFSIDRQTKPVDANGWEYYDVFSRKWSPNRHGCRTFIRRRRWVRVRGKLDTSSLADPAQADFHSAPVSPPGLTADPSDKRTVVILKKHGVHQSIVFNSQTIGGGHLLTIDLPGLPALDVRWDDSSLAVHNPLFSGQAVASEILRHLAAQAGGGSAAEQLANQEEIMECLKDQVARINLQRVTKIVTGLSEPQKVDLWRHWLESDGSTDPSTKPEAADIWRVVERHLVDVLATFVFDFYRLKFMSLVVDLYSQSCAGAAGAEPRRLGPPKGGSKRGHARPGLSAHTFLNTGERSPSFLALGTLPLEFWNSRLALFVPPAHRAPRRPFVALPAIRAKLLAASQIRIELHRGLKALNRLRRAATTAK
ncbi:hypothetical protein PtB15_1B133 [Puccinia triticina]|nr:hypothetical protein PtB15_1B133 [Puccinia triticina]